MLRIVRLTILLLLIFIGTCVSQASHDAATSSSLPGRTGDDATTEAATLSSRSAERTKPSNATCHSRTANYITGTLPQQCLRTNRTSSTATDSTSSADASGSLATTDTEATPISSPAGQEGSTGTSIAPQSVIVISSESATPSPATSAPGSDSALPTIHQVEAETDSPLDNANFLSFEEWKKQNLAKAGQSPENLGRSGPIDADRRRPGINNALDTLGEESEIELDFSGFGGGYERGNEGHERPSAAGPGSAVQPAAPQQTLRSKDAGKTCKERTNYASFDCAATILKNNAECKSGSSILVENKDNYLLNKCSADNKFIIVELCNDILIDTIVLANYEFFSSIFRHFRISVSDRYPVKMEKWKDLGTFEARNTREVQAFLVENPLIWARYLRIEFLTHYGNEYYCPVSLLRVHGTTMMDEFRHQEEIARGEPQDDDIVVESEVTAEVPIAQEPASVSPEAEKETAQALPPVEEPAPSVTGPEHESQQTSTSAESPTQQPTCPPKRQPHLLETISPSHGVCLAYTGEHMPSHSLTAAPSPTSSQSPSVTSAVSSSIEANTTPAPTTTSASTIADASTSSTKLDEAQISYNTTVAGSRPTSKASASVALPSNSSSAATSTPSSASQTRNETVSSQATSKTASSSNITRANASNTSPQQAQPSTQESFFKSVHKRLQQLESNSTLSLQYIEEQSRILRDAFSKVEKRQVTATTNFLSHVNETIMAELNGFRQAYDQLWQSTVIELEGQREQYQREMLALSTRLTLVADELVWQKRMGIVQSTLLLLCLALVLFNRAGNNSLEMPLLQHMMQKSQAAFRMGDDSPPNSPSPENRSPVSIFRRKLWRHSTEPPNLSGNVTDATDSRPQSRGGTDVNLRPPTPEAEDDDAEEEEASWKEVPEIQSGPATPNGIRENRPPSWNGDLERSKSPLSVE